MPPPEPAHTTQFTEAHLYHALSALEQVLQDYEWQPGANYLGVPNVVACLLEHKINHALAQALIKWLVDEGAFVLSSLAVQAGSRACRALGVTPVSEPGPEVETTETLETTRECWDGWLADNGHILCPKRPRHDLPPSSNAHGAAQAPHGSPDGPGHAVSHEPEGRASNLPPPLPCPERPAPTSRYDPYKEQPRTMGELRTWMLADAAFNRATKLPSPVPLNPPPIPGLDTLSTYSSARYGKPLSVETVRRMRSEYALACGLSPEAADAATIEAAADELRGTQAPQKAAHNGPTRRRTSTHPGETRLKIIAALNLHHKYGGGGVLDTQPISVRQLARNAHVSPSTAKKFFDTEFGGSSGHANYAVLCRSVGRLADKLRDLNDESPEHERLGPEPSVRDRSDEDE